MPSPLRIAARAGLLGGSAALLACSGGGGERTARTTSSSTAPASIAAEAPSSAVGTSVPGATSGPAGGTRAPTPPATTARGAGSPPLVDRLPSGEVRIRDAEVGSVDRAARTFTLAERPQGFQVVVVNDATVFTLAEGDSATFADVEPEGVVAVTGTAAGPDRLLAKRVVVLA